MAEKKYRVIISDKAKQMLGAYIRFLANVSVDAAEKTKARIVDALRSLARMPERFSFFEEQFIPANKYHKLYIENWYFVLYQVKGDAVYVDYILDCRQDYSWLIGRRA